MGLPNLPRKLPSRNWIIFWAISVGITSTIIYDKREKRRAVARWQHAVEHLAREPLVRPGSSVDSSLAQPRKLTIYLSAPPGYGLRTAQDHYTEFVKPVLAASGLDWEFVQGRREGDVRAVVAERVRKTLRSSQAPLQEEGGEAQTEQQQRQRQRQQQQQPKTRDDIVGEMRKIRGIHEYEGVAGDVVIGRHTWKEYVRGLHEGWLGPLKLPLHLTVSEEKEEQEEKGGSGEERKPKVPRQPSPYNAPEDYPASSMPLLAPAEFAPVATIREPHILGFLNTPIRMYRYFNQRTLADQIGREVAAVCLCTYREFRMLAENPSDQASSQDDQPQLQGQQRYEQQEELGWEEKDWPKQVWKSHTKAEQEQPSRRHQPPAEKILARPIFMDDRVATRMRRFELRRSDEARARAIVVPEQEVEGFVKRSLRQLFRWGVETMWSRKKPESIPLDGE